MILCLGAWIIAGVQGLLASLKIPWECALPPCPASDSLKTGRKKTHIVCRRIARERIGRSQ